LLDQAPGALLAIEGSRVRAVNRAARALFATDDLVLPPPPALLNDHTARLRHAGRSWRIDRALVHGAGSARTLIALIDVEPAEHAAEARATRELLRVLGHEVMNAMAPISSLAESALSVMAIPERRELLLPEILGTLARRAEGLRRFTEAYRQVSRLPDPDIAPVSISDLFADVARLFDAQWHGVGTLAVADPGTTIGALDRDQIVQALLALLSNGVEAMQPAPTPPVVRLSMVVKSGRVTFRVSDDGPGVDPVHRTSIFLPFFTTKPDGNGIGLAAARQIAQGHGGDLALIPTMPTAFELSLPI
jgi:signal transduction histidine kinase